MVKVLYFTQVSKGADFRGAYLHWGSKFEPIVGQEQADHVDSETINSVSLPQRELLLLQLLSDLQTWGRCTLRDRADDWQFSKEEGERRHMEALWVGSKRDNPFGARL